MNLALGVDALAMMSSVFRSTKNDLNLKMTFDGNKEQIFQIIEKNSQNVQQVQLQMKPNFIQTVQLNVTGTGIGFAAVSCDFVNKIKQVASSFFLSVGSELENGSKAIKLTVCTNYIPEGRTGMAIVEINLPSGFKFQQQSKMYQKLQKVGVKVS